MTLAFINRSTRNLTQHLEKLLMATKQELVDAITANNAALAPIAEAVAKIGTETDAILQKVTELETKLTEGGADVPDDVMALVSETRDKLQALSQSVQAVDRKIPDQVDPENPGTPTA